MTAFRWLAAGLGIAAAAPAAAQEWQAGQIVLGSIASIPTGFSRCRVNGGPNANAYYDLTCLTWRMSYEGKKIREEFRTWVSGKWIKPDEPDFEPDMQFARVATETRAREDKKAAANRAATAGQVPTRDVPGGAPAPGNYQCCGGPAGNLKINFTGPGRYANDKGVAGNYTQAGPIITFTSGPWRSFYAYVYASGDVQLRTAPNRPSTMQCQQK